MREELSDALLILRSFFSLLDTYVETGNNKKSKNDSKKASPMSSSHVTATEEVPEDIPNVKSQHSRFDQIKKSAISKIIRPYREENDPLVMIRTAQNALNVLIQKGYNQKNHVLHVL